MCRSIQRLYNFEPPATEDEIRAAALQYVRKVSGTRHPSRRNAARFERAVRDVTATTRRLLGSLETVVPPQPRVSRGQLHGLHAGLDRIEQRGRR